MTKKKIMIVEDEIFFATHLQDYLKKIDFEVPHVSASGDEALERIPQLKPDLVLMDIKIKGSMDGIETAKIIYERYRTPIIFITAYSDMETLERARETFPFGFFVKPLDERQLGPAIIVALNKHKELEKGKSRPSAGSEPVEFTIRIGPSTGESGIDRNTGIFLKELGRVMVEKAWAGMNQGEIKGDIEKSSEIDMSERKEPGPGQVDYLKENPQRFTPFHLIKHVANEAGIEPHVIRRYEKEGLIKPYRDPDNNNRVFTQDDIEWIKRIWSLIHQCSMSVEGIRRLMSLQFCWDFFQCPDDMKNDCPVYKNLQSCCWKHGEKECYKCRYYIDIRRQKQLDIKSK